MTRRTSGVRTLGGFRNAIFIDAFDAGDKVTAGDANSRYELTFISHVDD